MNGKTHHAASVEIGGMTTIGGTMRERGGEKVGRQNTVSKKANQPDQIWSLNVHSRNKPHHASLLHLPLPISQVSPFCTIRFPDGELSQRNRASKTGRVSERLSERESRVAQVSLLVRV